MVVATVALTILIFFHNIEKSFTLIPELNLSGKKYVLVCEKKKWPKLIYILLNIFSKSLVLGIWHSTKSKFIKSQLPYLDFMSYLPIFYV